jgi:hypothetical protein
MIKSRGMRWARTVECMGEMRIAYRFLVCKPKGKSSFGKTRRRWNAGFKR